MDLSHRRTNDNIYSTLFSFIFFYLQKKRLHFRLYYINVQKLAISINLILNVISGTGWHNIENKININKMKPNNWTEQNSIKSNIASCDGTWTELYRQQNALSISLNKKKTYRTELIFNLHDIVVVVDVLS